MSLAFWISLVVCGGAFLEAIIDHRETLEDFRASTGKERRWNRFKLGVYWFVFGLALVSTLITGWDSISTDRKIEEQAKEIANHSNALHVATQRLAQVEQKTREKPLSERLRKVLDEIDPQILVLLKTSGNNQFQVMLTIPQIGELQKLCAEPEAAQYIQIKLSDTTIYNAERGPLNNTYMILNTNFVK